ncbi:unnamed protein product [Lymnaea stagnalis]|uniref:Threonine aspartase 1 n=1 Tax=Lymnaea stagnalis TaxID=6523 RepID=A0AAV2IUC0_LYMST
MSSEIPCLFIAVHAGAGSHAKANDHIYKSICKKACQQAMSLLQAKGSALEGVTAAVSVLENDEITNCGKGSSLTVQGTVECDACVMDGSSLLFGAVGALCGVANPVTIACRLVDEQKLGPLPYGRIRPSILVGRGAQDYCAEHGIEIHNNLVTGDAWNKFLHYSKKCRNSGKSLIASRKRKNDLSEESFSLESKELKECRSGPRDDSVQDTVGAICVDHDGNVAAASSSGGIWLKHSGRLGPCAIYGAGCWAQNQISETKPGVAAVTSGCGEHLMMTLLAKNSSDSIRSSDNIGQSLVAAFKDHFLESEFLKLYQEKFGAVLILRTLLSDSTREIELSWIHSTESMCLGYMAGKDKAPTVTMSRLEDWSKPGQSFSVGGHVIVGQT